ncbi:MAG TPA: FMN-binding negative transcriptional regulator [Solimonas sp.]|nr:FMN-binding negative transcriptional regulator [Solimonas sp.]
MATYIPRHFASDDREAALRFCGDHPFATLVTAAGAEPQITHLPLFIEDGVVIGHFARPNPHAQMLARGTSVAVFQGPHAYISPRWYETPAIHVPTWNFTAVHLHGQPELLDEAGTREAVLKLTAIFEQGRWAPTAEKVARLVGGVVGFRMPVARVEAKYKMNQNRTAADRAGVIENLRASGRSDDLAVAEWMAAHERPL